MRAGLRGAWRSRSEPAEVAGPVVHDPRRACLERAATAMGDQLRDGDELVAFTATVRTRDGRQEHVTVSTDLWLLA